MAPLCTNRPPSATCQHEAAFQTDELSIAYDDTGSDEGDAAVLLHGWPDDASA